MCGLFVSVGTSAQFSHLRHRIAAMKRGCYLSQTKQSGELFWRSDTMRQRQLPTTYSKSQVRAARTSQSPFCHSVTFSLSGESLFYIVFYIILAIVRNVEDVSKLYPQVSSHQIPNVQHHDKIQIYLLCLILHIILL